MKLLCSCIWYCFNTVCLCFTVQNPLLTDDEVHEVLQERDQVTDEHPGHGGYFVL